MHTYKFDKNHLSGIMSHIDAYGFTILSLIADDTHYTIVLDNAISQEEVEHLQSAYQLEVL